MVHAGGHAGVDRPAGRGSTGGDFARGGREWASSLAMTRMEGAERYRLFSRPWRSATGSDDLRSDAPERSAAKNDTVVIYPGAMDVTDPAPRHRRLAELRRLHRRRRADGSRHRRFAAGLPRLLRPAARAVALGAARRMSGRGAGGRRHRTPAATRTRLGSRCLSPAAPPARGERQPEQREQRRGVEERVEADDPAVGDLEHLQRPRVVAPPGRGRYWPNAGEPLATVGRSREPRSPSRGRGTSARMSSGPRSHSAYGGIDRVASS